ncbi:MAG: helix-hairpin-helix domain-containing protein [Burkholderiales bacterium]|nr:helix-hairpin-helix domain-containing protein [Burkholderiales bacterium]
MLKKFLLAIATLIMTMGIAFAQVDVNKADQAALDGVKGIGPALSKSILAERKKGGDFKDWADFQKRVKGIGDKSSDKLSAAGLTVNGQPKSGVAASASASADAKAKVKDAKADTKKEAADAKADAKAAKASAAASAFAPAKK